MPYALAISARYPSTSSADGVAVTSLRMTFGTSMISWCSYFQKTPCTHTIADTTITVLHDCSRELSAVLVHQDIAQYVKLCKYETKFVSVMLDPGLPLSSVRGAAWMMLQTPSLMPGSGSRELIIFSL